MKKPGFWKKNRVLQNPYYSSIWVLYKLNTGFVRFKYGFCADETHLFGKKPGFSWKLKKNLAFEKRPTNSWVLEALGHLYHPIAVKKIESRIFQRRTTEALEIKRSLCILWVWAGFGEHLFLWKL